MLSTFRKTALAAFVGVTALTGVAASAHADSLYFRLGHGDSRIGVRGDNPPPPEGFTRDGGWDRDRRDGWDRRGGWDRDGGPRRHGDRFAGPDFCGPDDALDKADRMGIHRARVVDVSRRTIDIVGWSHGDRIHVTFARAPRCPVIG